MGDPKVTPLAMPSALILTGPGVIVALPKVNVEAIPSGRISAVAETVGDPKATLDGMPLGEMFTAPGVIVGEPKVRVEAIPEASIF